MPWVRRAYKGCKVYVEVDDEGTLVLQPSGLASFRYRPEDDRTYSARPERILGLEAGEVAPGSRDAAVDAEVQVHAAGASSGDPGPAGIGIVFRYRGHLKEVSRFLGHRSRSFADLLAVRTALETLKDPSRSTALFTDSPGCHALLTRGGSDSAHPELLKEIRSRLRRLPRVQVHLTASSPGSDAGDPGQEQARSLALQAIADRQGIVRVDGRD